MDNMQNLNGYLNEKAMKEALRGGPAYYRKAGHGNGPDAQYKAELRDDKKRKEHTHRVLNLRLPGQWRVNLRLPGWVPVGKLAP